MWSVIKENPKAVILAVGVHLLLIGILVFSFSFAPKKVAVNPHTTIVKATVIDEEKIKSQREKKQAAQREEERRKKEQQRKKEEKRKKEQQQAEARRQQELKKKREQEKQKKIALKKKQEAERKKIEAKKKAEAERKKQEQKRKAEELKKQKQEAERKAREAALKKQLEEEQKRLANEARQAAQQKEIDKYQLLIKQAISNRWRIPVTARIGQACVLKLRLIPSGDVVGVEVIRSSGDSVFDRSVEAAVYKASPLPLPPVESGLYEQFREINVPFRYEQKN